MSEIFDAFANGDIASCELRKLGFFRESAVLRWLSVRCKILKWVGGHGKNFCSTEQALGIAILSAELSAISDHIVIAYSIGVMAEWDQYYNFDEAGLALLEKSCSAIEINLNH